MEKPGDSLASLYNFGFNQNPQSHNFVKKKSLNRKMSNQNKLISNQFSSETKGISRRNKHRGVDIHGSYKRSYVNQIKKLSSKYKSEKGSFLFKNQSHSHLRSGDSRNYRDYPNIYGERLTDVSGNPRFPSPSHQSTQESSFWMQSKQRKSRKFSSRRSSKRRRQKVESTYTSDVQNIYRVPRGKDYQRPIININLGNHPVENLKIVSVPNEEHLSKDAMTIQVSYTPSGTQPTSKLDNLLSLENSKADNLNGRRMHLGKKGNMVKSILSKRRKKKGPGKEFVIHSQGHTKTYEPLGRMNNEGLSGFQDISNEGSEYISQDPYFENRGQQMMKAESKITICT
jgi:hypothetical protein